MPLRRQPGGKGGGRRAGLKLIVTVVAVAAGVIVAGAVANYTYLYRGEIKTFFSTPKPPTARALDEALEQAYARIKPVKVSTTSLDAGAKQLRCDRVIIAKKGSIFRANYEITSAVEKAGGHISRGVESVDDKGHEVGVTLSVSDGQSVVREVRIERSKR